MPTLSEPAAVAAGTADWRVCVGCADLAPLAPGSVQCDACASPIVARPTTPTGVLRPVDFTDHDMSDLWLAGCVLAGALAEIAHDEVADPGVWDCHGTGPDEVSRLRYALDRIQEAVRDSRAQLAIVERRVHRRATRRTAAVSRQTRPAPAAQPGTTGERHA